MGTRPMTWRPPMGSGLLVGYHDAVHQQTTRYVQGLSDADLARIVDRSWDPPVSLGVRLIGVLADDLQHAGQAAAPSAASCSAVRRPHDQRRPRPRGGWPPRAYVVPTAPRLAVELADLINSDLEARGSDRQLCRLHAGNFGRCEVADERAPTFGNVECGLVQTFELAVHEEVEHRSLERVGDIQPSRAPSAAAGSFARAMTNSGIRGRTSSGSPALPRSGTGMP